MGRADWRGAQGALTHTHSDERVKRNRIVGGAANIRAMHKQRYGYMDPRSLEVLVRQVCREQGIAYTEASS